ncbi:DUF2157 domain-containing protein [uncultured Fibrella sp.]|uniref:DUF2157 domain-containing protein n=1 Tax=uncultured Fibrella sp. TaxID=1284596 RepID=UPI0035CAE040
MSPFDVLTALKQRSLLTPTQADALADFERQRPVSLHHELRAALYVGILLLTGGLGLLIYEHYDEIGDLAIIGGMAALCVISFWYAWKNRPLLSPEQARNRSVFGDYTLLLSCLLFLSLEGYAQYRFNLFGTRYGLVTFMPAVLFLAIAYRFDHRGVLGMGLTALASWVGVTVRPLELRLKTNFFDEPTVLAAIGLGTLLIGAALWLEKRRIKAHFTYTLLTFAGNLLLLALLAGVFNFDGRRWLYGVPLFAVCAAFDWLSRREQVFLYRLMGVVYAYIGATYLILFRLLDGMNYPTEVYLIYFIATGTAAVYYLTHTFRKPR